jgi:hypothetical protein
MFEKIVSGGQTGADRAALDFAIKHKIPYGGWVPKGRLAEDGPLHKKYKLTEMPTGSYQNRTEQNVIDSDGTLIISHGRLTGGSSYTGKMAKKHNRPCFHIDLNNHEVFLATLEILIWLYDNGIKVLNVAGARASKDPNIYEKVTDILESALILESKKEILSNLPQLKQTSKDKNLKRPITVNEAVDRLMSEMKLKDQITLAKIHENDLVNLHFTIGMWIRNNFVYPRNDKLLQSCRVVSRDKFLHYAQLHMVIIRELWKKLQKTHRLKVIK